MTQSTDTIGKARRAVSLLGRSPLPASRSQGGHAFGVRSTRGLARAFGARRATAPTFPTSASRRGRQREGALVAKVKTARANDVPYLVRAPRETLALMKVLAQRHGHSQAEEMRLALDLFIAEAMLDILDHEPEFVEDVRIVRPEVDADEFHGRARRDVELIRAKIFNRPLPSAHLLDLLPAEAR